MKNDLSPRDRRRRRARRSGSQFGVWMGTAAALFAGLLIYLYSSSSRADHVDIVPSEIPGYHPDLPIYNRTMAVWGKRSQEYRSIIGEGRWSVDAMHAMQVVLDNSMPLRMAEAAGSSGLGSILDKIDDADSQWRRMVVPEMSRRRR